MQQQDYIVSGPTDDAARMRWWRAKMTPEQRKQYYAAKRARYAAAKKTNPEKWRRQQDAWQAARKRSHYAMNVRFPHDDMAHLKKIAKDRNCSVAELVRTFVTWALENELGDY